MGARRWRTHGDGSRDGAPALGSLRPDEPNPSRGPARLRVLRPGDQCCIVHACAPGATETSAGALSRKQYGSRGEGGLRHVPDGPPRGERIEAGSHVSPDPDPGRDDLHPGREIQQSHPRGARRREEAIFTWKKSIELAKKLPNSAEQEALFTTTSPTATPSWVGSTMPTGSSRLPSRWGPADGEAAARQRASRPRPREPARRRSLRPLPPPDCCSPVSEAGPGLRNGLFRVSSGFRMELRSSVRVDSPPLAHAAADVLAPRVSLSSMRDLLKRQFALIREFQAIPSIRPTPHHVRRMTSLSTADAKERSPARHDPSPVPTEARSSAVTASLRAERRAARAVYSGQRPRSELVPRRRQE
jgi:hypothetical protein